MDLRVAVACAVLLAAVPARAQALIGYLDELDSSHAVGWGCVANTADQVDFEVFAGIAPLGIYPTNLPRYDVARVCQGLTRQGFEVRFDRSAQDMLAAGARLSVYQRAAGMVPRLLPPVSAQVANPLDLPSGALAGLTDDDVVTGTVAAARAPLVRLYGGGPAGEGSPWPAVRATPLAAGGYGFRVAVPRGVANGGPGAALPVFGTTTDRPGVVVALSGPLALAASRAAVTPGSSVALPVRMAQQGGFSGIRNTTYTAWLADGLGFAGLRGQLVLSGTDSAFSEALLVLGTTGDGQARCAGRNGAVIQAPPSMARLWAGALKNDAATAVFIPVGLALPHAVPGNQGGTCVLAWLSAGYAYLSAGHARYTTTLADLTVSAVPTQPGRKDVVPLGLGGEFRFAGGEGDPTGVYVGLRADTALVLDGVAGTMSAAPVLGAPAGSHWLPTVAGHWRVQGELYYLPAAVCAAQNYAPANAIGMLTILRDAVPAKRAVPSGATKIMDMRLQSLGSVAVQRSTYQAVPPAGGFSGALAAGDCLMTYDIVAAAPGVLDVENQSTVYLRRGP